MRFLLNQTEVEVPASMAQDRLLWVLRDEFELNGPRYGCGVGVCGACVVHVDGAAVRACTLVAQDVAGKTVVTLEGLGQGWPEGLHPVQRAFIDASAPQCGYCHNGQVMTAAALLEANPNADARAVAEAMDPVICRCGTYARIRVAISKAQSRMKEPA